MAAQPATVTLDEATKVKQEDNTNVSARAGERERLAGAFRDLGHGKDGASAFKRMKDWCRASGAAWTRSLT